MATLVDEMPLMEWIERTPKDLRWMLVEILKKQLATANLQASMYARAIRQLEADMAKDDHTPALQEESPDTAFTICVCCAAGGDSSPKACQLRTDTGIKEGWYCEDCYKDWKNTP